MEALPAAFVAHQAVVTVAEVNVAVGTTAADAKAAGVKEEGATGAVVQVETRASLARRVAARVETVAARTARIAQKCLTLRPTR